MKRTFLREWSDGQPMFYPAFLNLQNRKCLVVGGGTVAERKVVSLLLSGGDVTVISPEATELLKFLAQTCQIVWHNRRFATGDASGYFLVCAATDESAMNTSIFTEAHEENRIRLVNVVDVIPQCTFAAASIVTDGAFTLSISTSGKSPATSRRIREFLEAKLGATSLYTLGYQNGKPERIQNQRLPYPVYLLVENRRCAVLYREKTPDIKRRISLLRQCGADVVENPKNVADAFLVIAEFGNPPHSLTESIAQSDAGTFQTPRLITDNNLIIGISSRKGEGSDDAAKRLQQALATQFENNGYGAFIEFLGTIRPDVLKAFQTSKARADFFETLINYRAEAQPCCLRLTDATCSAECLFNWIRRGEVERAKRLVSTLLTIR